MAEFVFGFMCGVGSLALAKALGGLLKSVIRAYLRDLVREVKE